MGMLVDGVWKTEKQWFNEKSGRFERRPTTFRDSVRADGASPFSAESGRYHLFVSYACPWAHRTLIVRALRKLDEHVGVTVVDYHMGEDGWTITNGEATTYLRDWYVKADPKITARVTVPILWDNQSEKIVNNESREIIKMFDTELMGLGDPDVCFRPAHLESKIEEVIDAIYEPVNNGVYRSGFAGTQEAYLSAVTELFEALDHWEDVLSKQRYLCGDVLTEADWCLFTTLLRFDLVYYVHFKCNLKHIYEYPNLFNYLKELYQIPQVRQTCNFEHIKGHYFGSHLSLNPRGIVPKGPLLALGAPHDRT